MSIAELIETITDEETERLEHDTFAQTTRQEDKMTLVEFAEKIAPFPLSEFQKQLSMIP